MLDALIPAATAMTTGSIADQLDAAAQAARDGAAGTAAMQSRRGRSSYIDDRALGHPDPGAVAVAMWLEAAARPELERIRCSPADLYGPETKNPAFAGFSNAKLWLRGQDLNL